MFGRTLVSCLVKILSLETKCLFSRNDEEMKKIGKLDGNHTRNCYAGFQPIGKRNIYFVEDKN